MHQLKIRVASANYPATHINVFIAVTQSGVGGVLFKVEDIYTAADDPPGGGSFVQGLAGATVRVQNEQVLSIDQTQQTNADGEALFMDLPAGR